MVTEWNWCGSTKDHLQKGGCDETDPHLGAGSVADGGRHGRDWEHGLLGPVPARFIRVSHLIDRE